MKSLLAILLITLFAPFAYTAGNAHATKLEVSRPAPRYSGSVPIDMKRGLIGSNGTYGEINPEIEKWSQEPMAAVNISTLPYPYAERERFLKAVDERMVFFDEALANYKEVEITPEAKEHASKAAQTLTAPVAEAKQALKEAKSAGEKDWPQAESKARSALLNLQGIYYGLNRSSNF